MSSFKIEELSNIPLNKKENKKVLKLTKKTADGKLSLKELVAIDNLIRNKIGSNDFYMRVLGIHGNFTPKSMGNNLNLNDIDDYTNGRVADNTKFSDSFFHVEVGFISKNK